MNRSNQLVVGIVILVLVVSGIAFARQKGLGGSRGGDYKAVFLSNGQVYFGKVASENGDPVVVRDIYYLRAQRPVQPPTDEDRNDQQQQQLQLQLIKLGTELHAPRDEMRINRHHVLFVEDLKDDGRVVQSIKEFQARGGLAATPPPTVLPSPTPSPARSR